MNLPVPPWNGNVATARALQSELAAQLVLRDQFTTPLRTVAGFAVAFADDGAIIRAAAVLLDADTLEVIDQQLACLQTCMPYIPGLRSFRELPALLAALAMLPHPPDLTFVDGHGFAHQRRLGIAAHFGLVSGLPSIGIGKRVLVGTSVTNLHEMRGAFTPLRDGRTQIGWLLRSKPGSPPLVVSPGHKVALASAPELVMRYVRTSPWPEPTRLAEVLALQGQGTSAAARP